MQAAAITQGMPMGQTTAQLGMAQAGAAQGGDFMQLIMQMMGQGAGNGSDLMGMMGGGDGTASMDELLGLTGKEDDEQDTDYLMQLMAGMLGHGMPQIAMYNSGEEVSKQAAEAAAMDILSAVQAGLSAAGDNLIPGSAQFAMWATTAKPGELSDTSGFEILPDGRVVQPNDLFFEKSDTPIEVLTEGYSKNGQPTPKTEGEQSLMQDLINSMGKPQQSITQAADGKKQEIIDIDALQQAVDSGRYLTHEMSAAKELGSANPQTMDILAQVKTGILANMDKGSNEFVIKLKPEGLGEITVKMTEVAGKVSLSIITANQHTQNALAGEISTLRDALRPYNAEISQVITQQDANLSQGFGEHKHGQQQEQQDSRYGWTQQTDDPRQTEYVATLASALNAYI